MFKELRWFILCSLSAPDQANSQRCLISVTHLFFYQQSCKELMCLAVHPCFVWMCCITSIILHDKYNMHIVIWFTLGGVWNYKRIFIVFQSWMKGCYNWSTPRARQGTNVRTQSSVSAGAFLTAACDRLTHLKTTSVLLLFIFQCIDLNSFSNPLEYLSWS